MSDASTRPQVFDARMAARLDRLYASPQVVAQRQYLRALIDARPGEQVLDVGCGLGHLSCELALDVGPGGRVTGVDASDDMVAGANARAARLGVADRVHAERGDATALAAADASVDVVVAVQSWSYVPQVERALAEAVRVLRPGGRLAVLETDWDLCVVASPDAARMRQIFDGRWRFAHWQLPRALPRLLRAAGLTLARTEVFAIVETAYDADSFGAGLITVARDAAVRHGMDAALADAWVAEVRERGAAGDYFFCLNRFIFIAVK